MSKKLIILVAPMEGVGHVNATIGIAEALRDRGHRIVYVVLNSFEGKLKKYGFEEELLINEETKEMKPGENIATKLKESGLFSNISSLEKMKILTNPIMSEKMIDEKLESKDQVEKVVKKVNPDIILVDDFVGLPCLIHCGKPWVNIASANPLFFLGDEKLPPAMSGYATDSDPKEWKEFQEVKSTWGKSAIAKYNKWMTELGLPTLDQTGHVEGMAMPYSPFLNIYAYPEELDYTDIRPIPDNWFALDYFTRKGEEKFEIPDKFKDRDEKTEKLIYLSLGSMGSINVELMQRLVGILANSPHKFIVSKGVLGDQYELADNMWGQNSVPQTKVLPLVDLVIIHGGNNSTTETFTFGKPMIILPLFADQFDNAQRVHEKGFGLRLNPFDCSEEELLNAIEKLLNDNELKERLRQAVERMERDQKIVKVAQLIENLAN